MSQVNNVDRCTHHPRKTIRFNGYENVYAQRNAKTHTKKDVYSDDHTELGPPSRSSVSPPKSVILSVCHVVEARCWPLTSDDPSGAVSPV